jgi:hypothetical protein
MYFASESQILTNVALPSDPNNVTCGQIDSTTAKLLLVCGPNTINNTLFRQDQAE